jgi:prepilin-type N-terminal cleavage/methylation domain-containing protein
MAVPQARGRRVLKSPDLRRARPAPSLSPRKGGSCPQCGFTLLEVLVAIAVLAIALTVFMQLFSMNLRSIGASEDHVAASIRAEAKMREILDDEELGEKAWSEIADDGSRIDVSVTEALKERSEALQVMLFDVELTVRWKKGDKERVQTLRTLKVMPRKV